MDIFLIARFTVSFTKGKTAAGRIVKKVSSCSFLTANERGKTALWVLRVNSAIFAVKYEKIYLTDH